MKFGQFMSYITKEKISSKNYAKTVAWKLVPGPFVFAKNDVNFYWQMKFWKQATLPCRIDVTSRQLIFWEFFTHNSVISATTFIKNGPNLAPPRLFQATHLLKTKNRVVQLPRTPLFQPPHHLKLENVFVFTYKCDN